MVKVRQRSAQPRSRAITRWWWATLTVIALSAATTTVAAHPETMPALVNRYITLLPAGRQLGIDVVLLYGTVPAAEQRRTMDANRDGTISEAELAAEKQRWGGRAGAMVSVLLDEHPRHLGFAIDIDLNGKTATNGDPMLVQLRGHLPLDPGDHRIVVEAGPDLFRMGETEIVLAPSAPWLLHAGVLPNGQSSPAQSTVKYDSPRSHPGESRHAGFVIRSHTAIDAVAPGPSIAIPAILVGFSLLLGIALVVVFRRMDRKRREPTT